MCNWRNRDLQGFNVTNCVKVVGGLLVLLTVFGSADVVNCQTRVPGTGIRDGNRAMDEYDRTINRMKNDAKAVNARRRSLFPQINEDFQRIQVIHNEIVRMLKPDNGFNYDRLAELSDDLKRRTNRLRTNLALPEPEKAETEGTHSEAIDDAHMKDNIAELHDLIVSFVANPIFKNLGVVDSNEIYSASDNLTKIVGISDEIKKEAKLLGKTKKDPQKGT
ncbi:MAG TPA: hypothetical protein VFR12_04985 [Pyrinomonadaceae bacterium]|nr:hypothetical protein [Pyrinomonadaceae bacterium]